MKSDEVWPLLTSVFRLLTFRITRQELLNLDQRHLAFGLACSWIVGAGRYWDSPNATFLQHLGTGSVTYVFGLALLIWLIGWPLEPDAWSYRGVVTFVTLTSPPAILYAIPVERLFDLAMARSINVGFLALVAAWRVALLVFYLARFARFRWHALVVVTLLPLTLVVASVAALDLEQTIFQAMAGLPQATAPVDSNASSVLGFLTLLSSVLLTPLLVAYFVLAANVQRRLGYRGQGEVLVEPVGMRSDLGKGGTLM